jgi:hypothetical protein
MSRFDVGDNIMPDVQADLMTWHHQQLEAKTQETAKAYGGCTNCYGKGYATCSGKYYSRVGDWKDKDDIKYCACERGRQLESLVEAKVAEARVEGAHQYNRTLTNNLGKPTYMNDEDSRHAVYKQAWISEAIRAANDEAHLDSTNNGEKV